MYSPDLPVRANKNRFSQYLPNREIISDLVRSIVPIWLSGHPDKNPPPAEAGGGLLCMIQRISVTEEDYFLGGRDSLMFQQT